MGRLKVLREAFREAREAYQNSKTDPKLKRRWREARDAYRKAKAEKNKEEDTGTTDAKVGNGKRSTEESTNGAQTSSKNKVNATETGQKKKRKKSKKRKRKSIDEENVTEAEKIRRSVQRAAQSYTLKLLENKKLDKKERKKMTKAFVIKERRRQKIALAAAAKTDGQTLSRASSWRRKVFGDVDSRFIDPKSKAEKQQKFRQAAEKGAKHDLVIIPIFWKQNEEQKNRTVTVAERIKKHLSRSGLDVWIDARHKYTPGQKFAYWEHLGISTRIEIGPNDLEESACSLRYSPESGKVAESLGKFPFAGRCKVLIEKLSEHRKSHNLSELKIPSDDEDPDDEKALEPEFDNEDGDEKGQRNMKREKNEKRGGRKAKRTKIEDDITTGEDINVEGGGKGGESSRGKKKHKVVRF